MKPMTDSMCELESILRLHAKRYPMMQCTDAVKLIYQNEFGGGHLIRDEESCINYLLKEHEAVVKDASLPICEQIGNGMVRVNLAAVRAEDLEQLGACFIRAAARHTGSLEQFVKKLDALRQLTREGIFSFGPEELERYLLQYAQAGYPMVSHSEAYRRNYHPAYRAMPAGACVFCTAISKE